MPRRGAGEGSVYKRADGLWAGSVELPSHDGKRRRKVVTHKNKTVVMKALTDLRRNLERNGDLPTASMTVEQWFDYWLREIAPRTRRPKTLEAYRSAVKRRIIPVIGNTRLDKLTPATIRKVVAATEEHHSSTYARNVFAVMSAAFKDAEREGRIPRNPVELVQAPRKAVTNLTALTLDDALELMGTFREDDPDSYMWATFLLTGARRGEVLGLEWDRLIHTTNPDGSTEHFIELSWQIQRFTDGQLLPAGFEYRHLTNGLYLTRPKSRAGWRVVPLVEPLLGILRRWETLAPENPWGLVFTRYTVAGDMLPYDPDFVTKLWPVALANAGIDKNVRLHDIRHAVVDYLYAAGVEEEVISQIVGHSNRAVTRGYKSKHKTARALEGMKQLSATLGYDN